MPPDAVDNLPTPRVLTLMTVTAHPDDETLWAGGVMARYAAEGMRVLCVTCTRGENGSIVLPELDTPENRARLGEIRAVELSRALARLGSIENRWLGYRDSGMMGTPENADPRSFWQADPEEATGRLVRIVREVRPDVIVTFNERGGNGHPDHIRAALITRAAFDRAGDATAYPEQLGGLDAVAPWTPSKLYERRMTASRRQKVARLLAEEGIMASVPILVRIAMQWRPHNERARRIKNDSQGALDTEVDVGRWVAEKQAALAEHHTQMPADPAQLRYLSSAREQFTIRETRVEVHVPETDLFAGLRSG
ncbi:MAG: PIG-L family deacetylase [Candidatus Limnocylindrales bacterium]